MFFSDLTSQHAKADFLAGGRLLHLWRWHFLLAQVTSADMSGMMGGGTKALLQQFFQRRF